MRRADDHACGAGHDTREAEAGFPADFGDSEIDHLDGFAALGVFGEQEVLGLDVAVDDTLRVGG